MDIDIKTLWNSLIYKKGYGKIVRIKFIRED